MKLSNLSKDYLKVLNLVIRGIPSIQNSKTSVSKRGWSVLNLIITGIPSIPRLELACKNNEQEMF